MTAFFVLVGVLVVGVSRVVLRLAVGVVEFVVGDFVNVRGVCSCGTFS